MIMLPIPVPIIGSNKRLFIPLIYLVVTTSICYLFLVAFIHVHKHDQPISSSSSKQIPPAVKYKREILIDSINDDKVTSTDQRSFPGSLSPLTSSSISSWKSSKRKVKGKKIVKVEGETTGQDGTRRSNSTQVRSHHQDIQAQAWVLDETSPVHFPWIHDQQCKSYRINFAKKNTFKPRALVSFPGSGNSWLRYLIECATGVFTGSVYHDRIIYSSGLLGECRPPNDGSTIVQKTHHDTTFLSSHRTRQAYIKLTELMFGYRGILLIRNPYDALVSYWNFMHSKSNDRHRGFASQQNFSESDQWRYFVTESIPRWSSLITTWVENSESLLIVIYEKLKKNPRKEMIRILHYLDLPVNESRLDCLLKEQHLEGPFHRSHHHHNDSFNPSEKNFEDFSSLWNSKFLHQNEQNSSPTVLLAAEENISPRDNDYYQPSLDLIIQNHIEKVDRFLSQKDIPIRLAYNRSSC